MEEVNELIGAFSELTEEYLFYNGEVCLHYEPKRHQYLLSENGDLTPVDGVTSTCKIIDKSFALVPWACRMMAAKLLATVPTQKLWNGQLTQAMSIEDFQKFVLDAKDAHKEQLEEAGDTGHSAHAWIESYIKRCITAKEVDALYFDYPEWPKDERAVSCCKAALDWIGKHNVRWLETERKIYHRKHRYAGTMDGLCYVDSCSDENCCKYQFKDRLTIADWKTSNYLYIEYLLQTSAYMEAYNHEETHVASQQGRDPALATDRWVIRLGKDGGDFQAWHADGDDFEHDWFGFLCALKLKRQVALIDRRVKDREAAIRNAIKAERKAAKEAAEQVERERKAEDKARYKAEREAALKVKCKGADKYKGIRAPKCNEGDPCMTCRTKYALRQIAKTGLCDGDHAGPVCGSLHCCNVEYETRPDRLLR